MSELHKNYHYEVQEEGESEDDDHTCHITPEGLSIEFRDGSSFQAAMTPGDMFPDLDELDEDKQNFLVWFAKEKAKGRWYSPEEMDTIYKKYKGDLDASDTAYAKLRSRPFDSTYFETE